MFTWKCSSIFNKIDMSSTCATRYCLRVNNDKWLLQTIPHPSLVKSKSMFSFAAPKIPNSLPLSLRETSNVSLFKAHLKSYFCLLLLRMLPMLNNCAMFLVVVFIHLFIFDSVGI